MSRTCVCELDSSVIAIAFVNDSQTQVAIFSNTERANVIWKEQGTVCLRTSSFDLSRPCKDSNLHQCLCKCSDDLGDSISANDRLG